MSMPSTKVTTATTAVAIAVIAVWLLESTIVDDIPDAVAGAFAVVLTFAASYFVPERNPSPSARETLGVA